MSERARVRDATDADWEAIWPIFHRIVGAGETYAYDRDMDEREARRIWIVPPPARVSVVLGEDDQVVGSASMYRNRGGPGSHVASACFSRYRRTRASTRSAR